jgi:hypothetical protein
MILLQQDTHPLVGAANAHTIEQDLSFRRLQQTGNDAQQGGFPAAARPTMLQNSPSRIVRSRSLSASVSIRVR